MQGERLYYLCSAAEKTRLSFFCNYCSRLTDIQSCFIDLTINKTKQNKTKHCWHNSILVNKFWDRSLNESSPLMPWDPTWLRPHMASLWTTKKSKVSWQEILVVQKVLLVKCKESLIKSAVTFTFTRCLCSKSGSRQHIDVILLHFQTWPPN